jgi:8-oxo-dGTP diphosphatase
MESSINPSISVDCVVFGFDDTELKVLLVDFIKDAQSTGSSIVKPERKLPGSLIQEKEDLAHAAQRTLSEMTGLNDIFLRQLYVFSDPNRVSKPEDLNWVENTYGVKVHRIVTVAYFALVKINKSVLQRTIEGVARWHSVLNIKHLAFDHKSILLKALEVLSQQLLNEPIAFELLPKRFTIRQLQNLYEAILGLEIDNRNFRKKVLNFPCIKPLEEKEKGVAHKPARLYKFDKLMYEKDIKQKMKYNLNFIRISD